MTPRKQPATLLAMCHTNVANQIVSTCRMLQVAAQESPSAQILALTKRRIRPRFISLLPGVVRTELLERCSRMLAAPAPDGGAVAGSGPAPLYLLAILLAPDVKTLRVELCCYYGCSHQAALLRLLETEGTGLRSLELARSALLRLDRGLLRSALTAATNLRRLVLRNIAGDAILQVIGECCPVLEILDVAHSRQVTDAGLKGLLVNVELRDKQQKDGSGNLYDHTPVQSWSKLRLLSRLVPWLRGEGRNNTGKRGGGDPSRVLLQYCESSTKLCNTLITLDLTNTAVTNTGILLALHHVQGLQSFGDYAHTGRALEVLDKVRNSSTPTSEPAPSSFRLVSARSTRTSPRRLMLITRYFPELRSLVLVDAKIPPQALHLMPQTLTYLTLRGLPTEREFILAIYVFLRESGSSLIELALNFQSSPQGVRDDPLFDLAQVMSNCPRLQSLCVENASVDWEDVEFYNNEFHRRLRTVHMGRQVSAAAIVALSTWAPELYTLHVHTSADLASPDLGHISKHSKNLECFYVYEAHQVTSSSAVNALLNSCTSLLRVGNLSNWGLDCDGTRAVHSVIRANNLSIDLNAGSHWFCSPCIRGFS